MQPCLYYIHNLVKFLVLANQAYFKSLLEQQNNLTDLLKPKVNKTSKPRALSNSQFTEFMLKILHKDLFNIYLYDGVDACVSNIDAMNNSVILGSSLPMLFAEVTACSETILQ